MQKNREKAQEPVKKNYTPMWQNIFRSAYEQQDTDILNVLKKVPLFSSLTKKEIKKVSFVIYERTYVAGEFLFKEGNPGSAMFIIKSGTILIERTDASGEKHCYATLVAGDFLGELSLLDDSERSANARCTTKTTVIIIFRHDLFDLITREPVLGVKVLKELAAMIGKRLLDTNDELLKYKTLAEGKNG